MEKRIRNKDECWEHEWNSRGAKDSEARRGLVDGAMSHLGDKGNRLQDVTKDRVTFNYLVKPGNQYIRIQELFFWGGLPTLAFVFRLFYWKAASLRLCMITISLPNLGTVSCTAMRISSTSFTGSLCLYIYFLTKSGDNVEICTAMRVSSTSFTGRQQICVSVWYLFLDQIGGHCQELYCHKSNFHQFHWKTASLCLCMVTISWPNLLT